MIQSNSSTNRSVILVNNSYGSDRLNRFAKQTSDSKKTIDSRIGYRNKTTTLRFPTMKTPQQRAHVMDCSNKIMTDARAS